MLIDYCKNNEIFNEIENESLFYQYINEKKMPAGYTKLSDGTIAQPVFFKEDLPNNDTKISIIPQIIKLHGSINWSLDYANNIITVRGYINKIPFIVPPVLDKSQVYNNNQLSDIWSLGYEKIKNAKNIFIYGFSLGAIQFS